MTLPSLLSAALPLEPSAALSAGLVAAIPSPSEHTWYLGIFPVRAYALAILAGIAPEPITAQLQQRLVTAGNGLVETTLSQALYKFEALLARKDQFGPWVFDKIARDWGYMLFNGATSFWETRQGGWDFDNAGSLCHGWSATPVYFYGAYLLGIKPLSPGFRTFSVDPLMEIVPAAAGTVPTPAGPIHVRWEKAAGKPICRLVHPPGTTPRVPDPGLECQIENTC